MLSHNMTGIAIDDTKKEISVQFGQELAPMAKAMAAKGYGLPDGTCPTVGVAGHALGGGGWSLATSRQWGWLVDHIMCLSLSPLFFFLFFFFFLAFGRVKTCRTDR